MSLKKLVADMVMKYGRTKAIEFCKNNGWQNMLKEINKMKGNDDEQAD